MVAQKEKKKNKHRGLMWEMVTIVRGKKKGKRVDQPPRRWAVEKWVTDQGEKPDELINRK